MGPIKVRPVRKSRSVQDYLSEKNEKKDLIMEQATKAARAKIASEGRSTTKKGGELIIEDEEEQSSLNIKKINVVEEEEEKSAS